MTAPQTTGAAVEVGAPAAAPVHHHPSAWARDRAEQLRAVGSVDPAAPIPTYGSDEFDELAPNDARRWLSALRAAEAWRHDADPHVLAARLDQELDAAWRDAERDYAEWHRIAAQVRASANVPDHAELQHRRQQARTPEGQEVA